MVYKNIDCDFCKLPKVSCGAMQHFANTVLVYINCKINLKLKHCYVNILCF